MLGIRQQFKKTLIFALLLIFNFHPALIQVANSQAKKVRVGWFESVFNHTDQRGGRSGYAYDYEIRLAANTGWEYEYVEGTWDELYQKLLNGEIDLLSRVHKTEYNQKNLLLSDQPLGMENLYIITKPSQDNITTFNKMSLAGKRVGVKKGSIELEELKRWEKNNNISITICEYDIPEENLCELLIEGIVDAIVTFPSMCSSVMSDFVPVEHLRAIGMYFAVNKNRPDLLNELDVSMTKIVSQNIYFNKTLHEKYLKSDDLFKTLPVEDIDWLKQQGTIRIGYRDNYLPYSGTNPETGKPTGLISDFIDNINQSFAHLGINIEAVPYPTINDAIQAVQEGTADAAFPVGISNYEAEKHKLLITDDFVFSSELAVMRKADNFHSEGYVRAAINAENPNYISLIQEHYPNWTFVHFPSTDACLKGVAEEKADLLLISNYRLSVLDDRINDLDLKAVATGTDIELTFAVSKNNPDLYLIVNHFAHTWTKAQLNSSLAKYSDVRRNVTLKQFLKEHYKISAAFILIIFAIIILLWQRSIKEHKRAQSANQAKTRFLFSMSHDIRTPMNAIMGYTKLIQDNIGNTEKCANYIQKIASSSRFLLGLINNVLELARIESGKVEVNNSPVLSHEILKDLKILYADLFEKKGIKFIYSNTVTTKAVYCDQIKLNEIYLNILSNAYKYTHSGGEVRMSVSEEPCDIDGYTRFVAVVSDTGIGMSKEYLPTIFDDFTRESTFTENKINGTGLGMAIVKKLIDMLEGTITVESELGKGTTFKITIDHQIADDKQLLEEKQKEENKEYNFDGCRILLAEDNELNAEIAIEILSAVGFKVERADNGKVCVQKLIDAEAGYYDVILMDIQMPEMNGYEATRAIRSLKDKTRSKIPIIALTANAFEEDRKNAIKAGMNGHLGKPIEIDKLMATLGHVLMPEK